MNGKIFGPTEVGVVGPAPPATDELMGLKAFVFCFHNQLQHMRQVFWVYPALKYFVQAKWTIYMNLCENLHKK